MSWVCVNLDGQEGVANVCPVRDYEDNQWLSADYEFSGGVIDLPKGSIERLIGYQLTWKNEPCQIFEDNLAPLWKIDTTRMDKLRLESMVSKFLAGLCAHPNAPINEKTIRKTIGIAQDAIRLIDKAVE
jgi:hypothetical protein